MTSIEKLDHFTLAFIEALLWSENDESTPAGGDPFDANYSIEDLAPSTLEKIKADCAAFQEAHGHLFTISNFKGRGNCGSASEAAGHDFCLTRNGHGAGFWDGDWEEPAASALTEACEGFGQLDLILGDDRKIYCFPE